MKPIDWVRGHRNTVLLVCALSLGGLAALGARGYISGQIAMERDRITPRQAMAQVVVAKRDLGKGELVSGETMAIRELPRDHLPASAVPPERFEQFVGARLSVAMRAGEPLLQGSLEGMDVSTFSAKVREGIRAMTIAVDEINSLSGMLQPGDRIDLMLSVRMPGGATAPMPQEVTGPLMQDLRVLATGRQVRPGGDERQGRTYTAITVEVTPIQAQKLVVAQRSGKLTAMLRNPQDRSPLEQGAMDVFGLLGVKPVADEVSVPPRPVEVIVGGRGAMAPAPRSGEPFSRAVAPAASSGESRPPAAGSSMQPSPPMPAPETDPAARRPEAK